MWVISCETWLWGFVRRGPRKSSRNPPGVALILEHPQQKPAKQPVRSSLEFHGKARVELHHGALLGDDLGRSSCSLLHHTLDTLTHLPPAEHTSHNSVPKMVCPLWGSCWLRQRW